MAKTNLYLIPFILLSTLPCNDLKAQRPQEPAQGVVYRVEGLTSSMRDAIALELKQAKEHRLAYACVPAGILVFEAAEARRADELPQLALASMERHGARGRATRLDMDRNAAEAACAALRQ